jgi:hypothetical protein
VPHLDPDRLPLIAVGNCADDESGSAHLDECAACRDELLALRHVAACAADSQWMRQLPSPPERVWHRIATELAMPEPAGPTPRPPRRPAPPGPRPRRRRGPRLRTALVAAMAGVLAAGGTLVASQVFQPQAQPQVVVTAQATLAPPEVATGTAEGLARVLDDRTLHLHVTGLDDHPGYYEVWLINPDTMEMFSIGVLGDAPDAVLPLPPTVDLRAFRLVDISAEEYDGVPGHSGNTMVRGTLSS